jgi:hypothetical protein
MSWDCKRRGSGTGYYYRSVRKNGKPTKVYLGRGPAAREAATKVAQARQARQVDRDTVAAELMRLTPAIATMDELCTLAQLLTKATLIAGGFHEHRGQWRRCRSHE